MLNFFWTLAIYPIYQLIEFIFFLGTEMFKNIGIAIIAVSAGISVLCLPLYNVAEGWQKIERGIQKKLKPKIDSIKQSFSGDERYMMLSVFYRQNHYHPVYALRGTFGLLFQIPFFIAAYTYLSHLGSLQGASFLFIRDLGNPDALGALGAFSINILPILMTAINIVSGMIYTKGFPAKDKIQLYAVAGIFLVLLYNSPSGLVFYWTCNNIFSLGKTIYYKISAPCKKYIIYALISGLCIYCTLYVMYVLQFHIDYKLPMIVIFLFIAALPWLLEVYRSARRGRLELSGSNVFYIFAVSMAILWILTGLYIPAALINSSPQEFSFVDNYTTPLYFIYTTALRSFAVFIFWPFVLFFLFRSGIKKYFAIFALAVTLAALCNVFLFPPDYGTLTPDLHFTNSVGSRLFENIINIGVLIFAVSAAWLCLKLKKPLIARSLLSIFIFALAAFSIYNIYSIDKAFNTLAGYYKPEKKAAVKDIEPIFHFSKTGKNVFVLMLDMAASVFVESIFNESPELRDKYQGFVYYPNTVSFNGYTIGGAPPIFGGYDYTPLEMNNRPTILLQDKKDEALRMMPRLFAQAGFNVTVTDPPFAGSNWIPDLRIYGGDINALITDSVYTDAWIAGHNFQLTGLSDVIRRNLIIYSVFCCIPVGFREDVYMNGDWIGLNSESRIRATLNGYAVLDYLKRLTDFNSAKDAAILMVNNTTHENSFLQAPDYIPVRDVSNYGTGKFSSYKPYHVNAAAFKRLASWFDYLKENGVYDNTKIILVSDHGTLDANFSGRTGLPFFPDQYNPILLVKDFNAHGQLETDNTFMSTADVPVFALSGSINNPVNPYTGNSINFDYKKNPLYILINRARELNRYQYLLNPVRNYYVHTNIFDNNNWIRADRYAEENKNRMEESK
jgi:YidC/Oxa1 family membrane protein insertase